MPHCLIGLGSNLGDRASLLDAAIAKLGALSQVRVVSKSRYHETPPIGGPVNQQAFLNAAVLVETLLAPEQLLDRTEEIEKALGRRRMERWGPRSIDLDLLLYDTVIGASGRLELPHPRMAWRRFVLLPAVEVAPAMHHPKIGWTVRQLFDHLETARSYVAIAGLRGAGKAELARGVARRCGGMVVADPAFSECERARSGKSYGFDADAEIEFAKRRAEVLAADSPIWRERRPVWVSDFWLGQSAARIRALSKDSDRAALLEHWFRVVEQASPAKLTVLLDASADWCAERLVARGVPKPDAGELESFELVRGALYEQAGQPGCGPVIEVDGRRPADALEELSAAVLAMS